MKIELSQVNCYITLIAEDARDHYLIGRISGRLNIGTFEDGKYRKIDVPLKKLIEALAGEK